MIRTTLFALTAGLAMALATAPALAAGDAAKGEKVFKKCKACHSLKAGKNKVGPSLAGVVGRKAGAAAKYKYSKSMKAAGAKGLVWNDETLDGYLKNPTKFLRSYLDDSKAKSKMALKLKKEDDRENIAAFLQGK